jgi:hypothetical protein
MMGENGKGARRHWEQGLQVKERALTNDTRDGQVAWNFGRSRWDSVMHHFTLGSCIEWSVELGRSWAGLGVVFVCVKFIAEVTSGHRVEKRHWASPAEVFGGASSGPQRRSRSGNLNPKHHPSNSR